MSNTTSATVSCHCRKVTANVITPADKINIWECNCSDCLLRGGTHFVIPQTDLSITSQNYENETTLYLWGTNTAQRRFCKTCGILPWYIPRSNPEGFGIFTKCATWDVAKKPKLIVNTYDGVNWEESYKTSKIVEETKKE